MEVSRVRPEWEALCNRIVKTNDLQSCIMDMSISLQIDFVSYQANFNDVKSNGTPYIKTNFPAGWVRRYLVRDYARIDPVMTQGLYRTNPCFWMELYWNEPELISFIRDAKSHGIPKTGYFVPSGKQRSRRSIMNFSSHCETDEWSKKITELAPVLNHCAQLLHTKAVAHLYGSEVYHPPLTQREFDCLSWVARGKDAGSIAIILGISEHTVRDYCKSARHKLGCATLPQAIYRATKLRLLDD